MATAQNRTIAYIDGFNLHFGLLQRGWSKYLWLDLTKFAAAFLLPDQALVHTKYFISRISKPVSKQRLQSNFIDAVNTLAEFSIYYGRYQAEVRTCENCGFNAIITSEKKTDVNIATELLIDAFHDKFDAAILVTADADLTAPIVAIRKLFPEKSVVVAFPPKRNSYELRNVASSVYHIGEDKFKQNLLPEKVVTPSGFVLQRPDKWK